MIRPFWIAAAACAIAGLASCAMPPEVSRGAQIYSENCAVCHGADGTGTGPAAAGLTPPPADLTQIAAQNGGTFPLAEVMSTIDGYTREQKGTAMPEFGASLEDADTVLVDLGDGTLTPTPEPLLAVAEYLQSIQTGN